MQTSQFKILLIEDSPGDVELVRYGLRESKVVNELVVASDGAEAMEMLRGDGSGPPATRPDLILLDINLPKMNGHEVLEAIRTDEQLCSIPVVILTTSNHESDVHQAYAHHVNAYIRKPLNPQEFISVVHSIDEFWLNIVRLPA